MSSADPTSNPVKNHDLDRLVSVTLTVKEWHELTSAIDELTMGDYAPNKDGWRWMQEVMGVADRQTIMDLSDKILQACDQEPNE